MCTHALTVPVLILYIRNHQLLHQESHLFCFLNFLFVFRCHSKCFCAKTAEDIFQNRNLTFSLFEKFAVVIRFRLVSNLLVFL